MRHWTIINTSLTLISLILFMNLIGVDFPTVGQARYLLDKSDPLFAVQVAGELNPGQDLDRFCLEARKQLSCHKYSTKTYTWVCETTSKLQYLFNNKAYGYCTQQAYW